MSIIDGIVDRLNKAYIGELLESIWDTYSFVGDRFLDRDKYPKRSVLDSFEKFILNFYLDRNYLVPLSGGISMFILVPPYLSAPEYREIFGEPFLSADNNEQDFFKSYIKAVPILAMEYSPPQFGTKMSEDKLINGSIPHIDEITPSNNMNVTYYETKELLVYTFHKIWMDYIVDVRSGRVLPDEYVWKNGYLDYAGAAFILKFSQTLDLQYLGYAVGLIPTSRNPGDIVKPNNQNSDISTVNIPYSFYWYTEFTYYELAARGYTLKNPNGHPWLEKLNKLIKVYMR